MNRIVAASVFAGLLSAGSLALAQERPAPRPPPAEAFTACDGKDSGATCSVTFGDRTLDGTCRNPPPNSGESRLFCAPPHPPGPPPGPPPQ